MPWICALALVDNDAEGCNHCRGGVYGFKLSDLQPYLVWL